MVSPEEMGIDLLCLKQMLELFETGVSSELEGVARHVDALKQVIQLLGSKNCISAACEARQSLSDLLKRDAVATVVAIAVPERHCTSGEGITDDLCNLSHTIVEVRVTDIENFGVDCIPWRLDGAGNRITYIEDMDKRTPWSAVTREFDFLGRPC
jgi:hypothetical protein